jgi:hypothetical protein
MDQPVMPWSDKNVGTGVEIYINENMAFHPAVNRARRVGLI